MVWDRRLSSNEVLDVDSVLVLQEFGQRMPVLLNFLDMVSEKVNTKVSPPYCWI